MYFLKLVRYPNLIIIAVTMVLMRYCIIQPILSTYRLDLEFPFISFSGLILAVILIAAAGYLINDYFDLQIDTVNHPDKVIIGKHIKAAKALNIYYVMNICALVISFFISYKVNNISLFIVFPITIGLLWFYSTIYKRQLLTGNILISLIVSFVPILVALFDISTVAKNNHEYLIAYKIKFDVIFIWIGAFALFAFLVNLVREIIKDTEDFKGDSLNGRNTLPVAAGLTVTKAIIINLTVIILLLLGFIFYKYLRFSYNYDASGMITNITFDVVTFLYFLILVFIPFFIFIYYVIIAKEKKQYTVASKILKLVMITGILFAIVVRMKIC